jgi:Chaperone of endosialidase
MKTKIYIVFFLILAISSINAQTVKETLQKVNTAKTTATVKEVNKTTASGDSITFKNSNGNTIIKITDEGTTGSITIPSAGSAPTATTNKLYNVGGILYFNGSTFGGATSLDGLSDAINDGIDLFIGSGAGVNNNGGNYNTAVGINVLQNNTTGSNNTANGYQALYNNTTGFVNTANGYQTLYSNISGVQNTASGYQSLKNSTGDDNTAIGEQALFTNTTGSNNTAIRSFADVASSNLTNATAIGYNAKVNASNKISLGNDNITVIEGKVAFTYTSDSTKKENLLKADGEKVLNKFRSFSLKSWNYKGGNPISQRHYGIMAQEFFSAFGHDAMGTIGNDTTLTESDVEGISMIAIQALEKRTTEQDQRTEELEKQNSELRTENADLKKEFQDVNLVVDKLTSESKTTKVVEK